MTTIPPLDTDFVRAQFPAFQQEILQDQAFFENAGGSYTCRQVIDRLMRYYTQRKVQPYGHYEASRLAGEEMDEARSRLSAFLGVDNDELSFGPSTTQNTYVLAKTFGQMLNANDAIIVTNQDHEANTGPWRRLADQGIEVREWKIDAESGQLELQELEKLLDDKVKLVCFPHCSNIVAEINPVEKIVALAKSAGAYTCVDGVSYAPHGLPNIGKLGADIYLFSAYKTYGPHQGIMTIRRELAQKMPNQAHYFNADDLYKKFTPAGPDHAQIAASAGMVDYFEALYEHHFGSTAEADIDLCAKGESIQALLSQNEEKLLQPLLDYLVSKNSVRLLGPSKANLRASTVAVELREPGAEVAKKLASHGIMAGGSSFYGDRCLKGMGIDPAHGVLRLSFVHYTNSDEVEKLIGALDQVL